MMMMMMMMMMGGCASESEMIVQHFFRCPGKNLGKIIIRETYFFDMPMGVPPCQKMLEKQSFIVWGGTEGFVAQKDLQKFPACRKRPPLNTEYHMLLETDGFEKNCLLPSVLHVMRDNPQASGKTPSTCFCRRTISIRFTELSTLLRI